MSDHLEVVTQRQRFLARWLCRLHRTPRPTPEAGDMDRFAAWVIALVIVISLGEGVGFLIALN
jgi:hypothetical protein